MTSGVVPGALSGTASGVLVVGALGRMGARVRVAIANEPSLEFAAALEAPRHSAIGDTLDGGVTVSDDPKAALSSCAVAIDFTTPAATLAVMRAAADANVAYVCGTTGMSEDQRAEVAALASQIPIIHAPNFSLAVNVLIELTREAARHLGADYDAELVEIHHAAKRDAPSGTALRLAEAVAEGRDHELADHLVLERAGEIGSRPAGAIGVQTLRGGDIAGEHTVILIGEGERLELVHRAQTRDHFARGAVRAATWLVGREPGLYPIERVFNLE